MSHGITSTDRPVFAQRAAWHGLGLVVEDAPTIPEANRLAGLGWSVFETDDVRAWVRPFEQDPFEVVDTSRKLLVRSDTRDVLADVSKDYSVLQNLEIAELVDSVAREGEIKVESAGSLFGGRNVWWLLRGQPFNLNQIDKVERYLLVATSHDGSAVCSFIPTSIRVVCRNTLRMAQARDKAVVTVKHTGDMKKRLTEAKASLELFAATGKSFEENSRLLFKRKISGKDLEQFFARVYQELEGEIPVESEIETAAEQKKLEKSTEAMIEWLKNFNQETGIAGSSLWNGMNAVTRWYDHQRPRGGPLATRQDVRMRANLWGDTATKKARVMEMALAMC